MQNKKREFNFKNLSKKNQLIFTMASLLLLISISFFIFLPKMFENYLIGDFERRKNMIADFLATSFGTSVFFESMDNDDFVKTTIAATTRLPDFTHLYIYDDKGFLVYKNINDNLPTELKVYRPDKHYNEYYDTDYSLYIINKDIINDNNEKIGKISLIISTTLTTELITDIKYQISVACLVMLALGIIFTMFIAKLITNPLEKLLLTFNKIANGDLSERANITTNEEFGQLAKAFNQMVDNLEDTNLRLSKTSNVLELRVKEQTAELRKQIEVGKKAEEKLKETNQMFLSIINTSPLPIVTITNDYKVKSASPAVKNIFYYENFEIVEKVIPLIYANDFDVFVKQITRLIIPDHIEKFTIKGRKKNGQLLDLQIVSVALFNESGEHNGYILIFDDITERLLAEKALKESEIKYRSLIEDSVVGIAIVKNRAFTFINNAFLSILNFSNATDFFAVPFIEMVYSEDRTKVIELYEQAESTIYSNDELSTPLATVEIKVFCFDGQQKDIEFTPNVVTLNEEVYLQITVLDITARKVADNLLLKTNEMLENKMLEVEDRVVERTAQLNKAYVDLKNEIKQKNLLNDELKLLNDELTFKSEILDRIRSICYVWNENIECIYMSPYSKKIFKVSNEKEFEDILWNKGCMKYVHVDEENIVIGNTIVKDDVLAAFKEDEVNNEIITTSYEMPNEKPMYFQFIRARGQNNTMITAGAEITPIVEMQKQLKDVKDQLAKALGIKTKFISMVSHEFRTPLTVIMSCTSVIQQAVETSKTDTAIQYLDKIAKSVRTMTNLMEDALTVGMVDTKKLDESELVEIDFVKFVKSLVDDIQESYTFTTKAILDVKKEIKGFYSEETELKHIVQNLITNALKYTTNGKDVIITIDEIDNNLFFQVADKGIGIPEDDIKYLFNDFYRAKNVGNIEGTGLGLHIVKNSIDNLYGNIEVESTVNVGTVFTVTLPKDIRNNIVK